MTTPRWWVLALSLGLLGCPADDDDSAADDEPFEASLEYRGDIGILRIGGTHYEMGLQYGTLMRDKLLEGADFVEDSEFALLELYAINNGLIDEALENSYPEVLDECQGLVDAIDDPGAWNMDRCLLLAYGGVTIDVFLGEMYACSQFVAGGEATGGGPLVHGRNLDWTDLSFMIENPLLIVRHPDEGIPNVIYAFPGAVSPYQGFNAEGIAIATNQVHSQTPPLRDGRDTTQNSFLILHEAHTLDEAVSFLEAVDRSAGENYVISSGAEGLGVALETSPEGVAVREMEAGVVYATNHFVHPDMASLDNPHGLGAGTQTRFDRLGQLLDVDGEDTLHGGIDAETGVAILRDRYNPATDVTNPPELFNNGGSLANEGALQSMVFVPGEGRIYVASGSIPVPQNPYTGFTLEELFVDGDGTAADPPVID